MLRPEYEEAANARQKEASCLAANGHRTGAVYLAGYVIECRLKHFLQLANRPFPKSGQEGHHLRGLWNAAGFLADDLTGHKRAFMDMWSTDIRYSGRLISEHRPEDLLRAAQELAAYVHRRLRYARPRRHRKGLP